MTKREAFGELSSDNLKVGDIVEWSKWNSKLECFEPNYGVLISIKNEIKSNRIVSISRVMPLNTEHPELELFSLSLRLVSRSQEHQSQS